MSLSRRLATASAFETLPVAALLLEIDGTILAANHAATRLAERDLEGENVLALVPDLAARWRDLLLQAASYGQAVDEASLALSTGTRVLQLVVAVADVDSRPIVQAIAADITERKAADEAVHQRRLESLGMIAGGIAHDFNNLLVGVLAEATAAREHAIDDPTHEALRRIEAAARRMAQLTRQLLAFSGRAQLVTDALDPDALVGELRDQLAAVVGSGCALAIETGARHAVVEADPAQLRQAVLNLVANAADAGARAITLRTYVERACWTLDLLDDGAGIAPANLARIFDPFFTTKPDRHGLGLSAVHGIVRRLGGEIDVDSEPGRGARFRIWLPVLRDAAPTKRRAQSEPGVPTLKLAGLRVLVADDEPSVRATVRRLLERRGATVVVSSDGLQAEARVRAERFDLAILDVRMPGRSGHDVLDLARALHPGMPVILMSGYTEKTRGEGSEEEADAFLEKPFSARALDATIDAVLKR